MGYGDTLMAIGDAQSLHRRTGRTVAIGDGQSLIDSDLFLGLTELANSRMLLSGDESWVYSFPGRRPYIDYEAMAQTAERLHIKPTKAPYSWKTDYRPTPAVLRFTELEREKIAAGSQKPWIAIGPCIKPKAPVNKNWGFHRWQKVADRLKADYEIVQIMAPEDHKLDGVKHVRPPGFREALVYMAGASLYVGHEGGLHHAAAATGLPAVVVFGGFVNPRVTGYGFHVNLTGFDPNAPNFDDNFCGVRRMACSHCTQAMARITVEDVELAVRKALDDPPLTLKARALR